MCYAKPGPRCSYHAVNDFEKAKLAFETATTLQAKEKAAKKLQESQDLLDTTTAGQNMLTQQISDASSPTERELLRIRLVQGARLKAQQLTASKRGLPADADVTKITPTQIRSFVNENGDVMYRLTEGSVVIQTLPADPASLTKLQDKAWELNQTVPYFFPASSAQNLYGDKDKKIPSWQLAENVNAARVHEMLPAGYRASREGATDSTVSDIAIRNNKNEILGYVEVKMENAQAGQIVVTTDGNTFAATSSNDTNPYTGAVVDIINRQSEYLKQNPNGQRLQREKLSPADQETVTNWFKAHYKEKNVSFIAVTNSELSYTSVFPLDKVDEHANVSITMPRAKRSGSSRLPKKDVANAVAHTKKMKSHVKTFEKDGKTYVETSRIALTNEAYLGANGEYFLSHQEEVKQADGNYHQIYEVRKLSATKNMTLMFNFDYTSSRRTQGKRELVNWLKEQNTED